MAKGKRQKGGWLRRLRLIAGGCRPVRYLLGSVPALFLALGQNEPASWQAADLTGARRFAQAEESLQKAIAESPDSATLHGELGMLYYGSSHYEDAVKHLGRAAQLDPDSARYSLALAEALIGWRRFPVATDLLLALKAKFDHLPEYHYNLGLAYYGTHNFPAALSEFEKALSIAPKLAPAYFFAGNAHAAMGSFEAAVKQYRRAIEINPNSAAYCMALGKVLGQLGPEFQAEGMAWLRKALALNPEDIPSKFNLALACEKARDLSCATRLLEEIASVYPKEAEPHIALARIYYRQKQREKGDQESAIVKNLQRAQRQAAGQPGQNGLSPLTGSELK